MSNIRIGLNPKKRDNYAFFCPISRLHLTRSNPVDFVDGVTSNILRALKSQTLVDIDGVIDLETGELKGAETPQRGLRQEVKPVDEAAQIKEPEPTKEVKADASSKKGKKASEEKVEEKVEENAEV